MADAPDAEVDAFVASEEAKIAAGQAPEVAGDSYLEVGPVIGNVASVYDWCRPQMSTAQRTRWVRYANQAVWNVWHPDEATWNGVSAPGGGRGGAESEAGQTGGSGGGAGNAAFVGSGGEGDGEARLVEVGHKDPAASFHFQHLEHQQADDAGPDD